MNEKYPSNAERQDEFADDGDPLAELARIVAGEVDSYTQTSSEPHVYEDEQAEVGTGGPDLPVSSQDAPEVADLDLVPTGERAAETDITENEAALEAELMNEFQSAQEMPSSVPDAGMDEATLNDIAAALQEDAYEIEDSAVVADADEPDFVRDINASFAAEPDHTEEEVSSEVRQEIDAQIAEAEAGEDFQSELMSALENELERAEEPDLVPESQPEEDHAVSPLAEDSEMTGPAISSMVSEDMESPIETAETHGDSAGFDDHELEAIAEIQPEPVVASSLEDDLGAAFANEFEQMVSSTPVEESHIPQEPLLPADHEMYQSAPPAPEDMPVSTGQEEPVTGFVAADDNMPLGESGENPADGELDFAQAFAEELGAEQTSGQSGWAETETAEAHADFAEAATPDHVSLGTVEDPGHDGLISDLDDGFRNEARETALPQGEGSRKYAVAALVIALFAGLIALGYGFLGGDTNIAATDTPIIKASAEPVKVKPEDPGGRVVANQNNASYEKVEGNELASVTQENLVSRTEEPAIIDTEALQAADAPEELSQKADERLESSDGEDSAADTARTSSVTPRVVQVVTVKPDGTIVRKPVAKPEPQEGVSLDVASADVPAIRTEVKPVQTQSVKPLEPLEGAKTTNTPGVPTASPLPKPKPEPKPAAQAPAPAPKPVQLASTQQAAAEAPAPQPAANAPASEWVVQVSSQRSEAAARQSFNNMQRKYSALNNRSMQVQEAQVNGATYYRVRVQTSSKSDATQLCTSIANAGGNCFVTR
jgi:hypothetical protein